MKFRRDVLHIDLGQGSIDRRPLGEGDLRRTLGGRGTNALTLLEEVPPGTDALSPENVLLVSAGLLTGSPVPSAARLHIGARSPLTGLLGSSSIGGTVGPAMVSLGVNRLIVRGRSPRPVYLYLDDQGVELRDAATLWGKSNPDSADWLLERHGPEAVMLLIGPAGENRVPIACIVTQKGHAAGRTGLGAVMGSKQLKAVVFKPGTLYWPASAEGRAAVREYVRKMRASSWYDELVRYGSTAAVWWTSKLGMLATKNYREPQFERVQEIDGRNLASYTKKSRGCHRCPVRCKAEIEVEAGRFPGFRGERPDFEPLVALGSKVGLADPEAILFLHNLCDWLGLDAVSAGSAIAFAMDLWEEGILTAADTGGLELGWGDAEAMESLIRQMAAGEGLGGLLGRGVRRAAATIGRGAKHHALHVKGLELTAFDPRGALGTALGYAVSNRGGDYTSVYSRHEYDVTEERAKALYGDPRAADRLSPVGKAAMVKRSIASSAVLDALGLCKVPCLSLVNEYDMVNEARLISAFTGLYLDPDELFTVGERILAAERVFNLRFGAGEALDTLPELFTTVPLVSGPAQGSLIDLEPMRREFYSLMGWSEQGLPTPERLVELGLGEFSAEVAAGSRLLEGEPVGGEPVGVGEESGVEEQARPTTDEGERQTA